MARLEIRSVVFGVLASIVGLELYNGFVLLFQGRNTEAGMVSDYMIVTAFVTAIYYWVFFHRTRKKSNSQKHNS